MGEEGLGFEGGGCGRGAIQRFGFQMCGAGKVAGFVWAAWMLRLMRMFGETMMVVVWSGRAGVGVLRVRGVLGEAGDGAVEVEGFVHDSHYPLQPWEHAVLDLGMHGQQRNPIRQRIRRG